MPRELNLARSIYAADYLSRADRSPWVSADGRYFDIILGPCRVGAALCFSCHISRGGAALQHSNPHFVFEAPTEFWRGGLLMTDPTSVFHFVVEDVT